MAVKRRNASVRVVHLPPILRPEHSTKGIRRIQIHFQVYLSHSCALPGRNNLRCFNFKQEQK